MSTENLLGIALRTLPALIVFILAFVAAADPKSRRRWADLMYQMGSVRSDQRDDPKIQRGVRLPFFLVALALLAWPVLFYRHATRTLEVKSDIYSQPRSNGIYDQAQAGNAVTDPTTSQVVPGQTLPGQPAPNAPSRNIYGTPLAPG